MPQNVFGKELTSREILGTLSICVKMLKIKMVKPYMLGLTIGGRLAVITSKPYLVLQ